MSFQISYDEPHDRLTRIANGAGASIKNHPEAMTGDHAIVMLVDAAGDSGIGVFGYDDITAAVADIIAHLAALVETQGKSLTVIPIPKKGRDQ